MKKFNSDVVSSLDLFTRNNILIIPNYQRPYSWGVSQIKTLINDIEAAYAKDDSFYYTGNILLSETIKSTIKGIYNFKIIDGQQRITTFYLLLMIFHYLLIKKHNYDSFAYDALFHPDGSSRIEFQNLGSEFFNELVSKLKVHNFYTQDLIKYLYQIDNFNHSYDRLLSDNLKYIYNYFKNYDKEELYSIASFFQEKVYMIAIFIEDANNKEYYLFESINSKGVKLKEIDLIKSYAISKLANHQITDFLKLWTELLIATDDKITEYLLQYLKAFYNFNKDSIDLITFKKLMENQEIAQGDVYYLFSDLVEKIKYYKICRKNDYSFDDDELDFYHQLLIELDLKYAQSILFKLVYLNNEMKISNEIFKKLVILLSRDSVVFYRFLSLTSKEVKSYFKNMQDLIHNDNFDNLYEDFKKISVKFYQDKRINRQLISRKLQNLSFYYPKIMPITRLLLLAYENYHHHKINYQAFNLRFNSDNHKYNQIDHILPINPSKDDKDCKYYNYNGFLVLKEGHDFDLVNDLELKYSEFENRYLNLIGNLQVRYRSENIEYSNKIKDNFNSYQKIKQRQMMIINFILDQILEHQDIEEKVIITQTKRKLPNLAQMIELKIVRVGDIIVFRSKKEKYKNLKAEIIEHGMVKDLVDQEILSLNMYVRKYMNTKPSGAYNAYDYTRLIEDEITLSKRREKVLNLRAI